MKLFVIFIACFSILSASSSIDDLIVDIENSYGDERRVKMNQLKLLLRKSNLEQRSIAIAKLRDKLEEQKAKGINKSSTNSKEEHKGKKNNANLKAHMKNAGSREPHKNNGIRNKHKVDSPSKGGSVKSLNKLKQGHK